MNKVMITAVLLLLTACASVKTSTLPEAESQDQLILATLWYQQSAEMEALYLQCYRNAEVALLQNLAASDKKKPGAVVMDVDETVLDNSPFQVWQIINNKPFNSQDWTRWVNLAKANPLPGSVEFTKYADSVGVEVFYVSNRVLGEIAPTIKNLKYLGFADADSAHMFFKSNTSSKVARRDEIAGTHDILLLIGDNLADLDGIFEKRPDGFGIGAVSSNKKLFGSKYIILPNPMYGTWLSEMLKTSEGDTEKQKLLNLLQGF